MMFLEIRLKMEIISIVIVEKLGKFCAVVNFAISPNLCCVILALTKQKKSSPHPLIRDLLLVRAEIDSCNRKKNSILCAKFMFKGLKITKQTQNCYRCQLKPETFVGQNKSAKRRFERIHIHLDLIDREREAQCSWVHGLVCCLVQPLNRTALQSRPQNLL